MLSGSRTREGIAPEQIAASLERMRSGVRAVLAGLAICLVAASFQPYDLPDATGEVPGLSGLWLPSAALAAAGLLVQVVGILRGFVPGTEGLARVRREFATASVLIKVGYTGGLALLSAGLPLLLVGVGTAGGHAAHPLGAALLTLGAVVLLVAAVLLLLGVAGLLLLGVRMYHAFGDPRYLAFVLLLLASPVLPAISALSGSAVLAAAVGRAATALVLAGWVLLHSALGRAVGRLPRRLVREPVL